MDTTGPRKCVLIREVSSFQRLICTQKYTIGTSETVLIREVSLFQGLICAQEYAIGTSETVLIREASSFQRCPLREVPLYVRTNLFLSLKGVGVHSICVVEDHVVL